MTDLWLRLFLVLCSLGLLAGMTVGVAALARIRELERYAGEPGRRVADDRADGAFDVAA